MWLSSEWPVGTLQWIVKIEYDGWELVYMLNAIVPQYADLVIKLIVLCTSEGNGRQMELLRLGALGVCMLQMFGTCWIFGVGEVTNEFVLNECLHVLEFQMIWYDLPCDLGWSIDPGELSQHGCLQLRV